MKNDFFTLFDLPASFDIDKSVLKERFLTLQKMHHPDNHAGNDNIRQAEQNTALINHAYATLNRDDARAVYLLEQTGVAFNPDHSIADEPFLMQMMNFRIDLEDAIFDKDRERIQSIAQGVNQLQNATAQAFQTAFVGKDWSNAQTIAQKMKFLGNLYDDINHALSQTAINTDDSSDDDLYV